MTAHHEVIAVDAELALIITERDVLIAKVVGLEAQVAQLQLALEETTRKFIDAVKNRQRAADVTEVELRA